MNYKELLKKYMQYVQDCEGVNFMEGDQRYMSEAGITDEEWRELEEIDNAINGEE